MQHFYRLHSRTGEDEYRVAFKMDCSHISGRGGAEMDHAVAKRAIRKLVAVKNDFLAYERSPDEFCHAIRVVSAFVSSADPFSARQQCAA